MIKRSYSKLDGTFLSRELQKLLKRCLLISNASGCYSNRLARATRYHNNNIYK